MDWDHNTAAVRHHYVLSFLRLDVQDESTDYTSSVHSTHAH